MNLIGKYQFRVIDALGAQLREAMERTPIVDVQNLYNVANRDDDALIEDLARQGIPYVPFFPLGSGFGAENRVLTADCRDARSSGSCTAASCTLASPDHRGPV